jgi:beta-lactam-binding protein with PASTA domain
METDMNRIKRVMTWVMLLSILFFLISSSDLIHAQSGHSVQVPEVFGKTEADARAAIEGAGLVYGGAKVGPQRAHKLSDVGKVYAAVVGDGMAEGEYVEPGTRVLVLLWAPITVQMPNVVGMTEEEAKAAIEGADLVYGGATEVLQRKVKQSEIGRVIGATYPTSAVVVEGQLKPGTVVTVQIAGPPGVEVPNVIGKTEEEARTAIEGAGLVYGGATVGTDIPARPSDARRVRAVVVEGGNPDGYVRPGTKVSVVLLRSYAVQMPNVVGMTEEEAKAAIEGAHLVYGGATIGTDRAPTAAESNRVYATVVGGGIADEEYVEPGTTVSVVLWKPYGDKDRCNQINADLTAAKDINAFRALVEQARAENCDFYQNAYNHLLQWEQREERCNQIDAALVAASQAKDLNTFRSLVEQARIDNCNCYQNASNYLQRWERCTQIRSALVASSQAKDINSFRALVEQARIDNCDSYQEAYNYLRNWEQQIQRSATQPVFQPSVQPQPQPPQQTHPPAPTASPPCRKVCVQEEVIWLNVSDGRHSLCAGGVPRSPGPGLPPPKCERRVRCLKWETICR